MNAAIFTKSAKGLILASSLVAVSGVLAYAQESTLTLAPAAQMPLTNAYQTPPTGLATLGGHTFDLTSGTAVTVQDGKSATFTGSLKNPRAVYVLVNSYDSYWWYKSATAGTLTLNFSDGSTQNTALTVGSNIREWRTSGNGVIATTTDSANTNVWTGSAQPSAGGGIAVIDMLTIPVTSTGKTLTSVGLTSGGVTNGWAPLGVLLSAVTVDYLPFPGNSGNTPAAANSQAPLNAKSAIFSGTSPSQGQSTQSATAGTTTPATTDGDKHTSRSHR